MGKQHNISLKIHCCQLAILEFKAHSLGWQYLQQLISPPNPLHASYFYQLLNFCDFSLVMWNYKRGWRYFHFHLEMIKARTQFMDIKAAPVTGREGP
jgi:hypothetical protein